MLKAQPSHRRLSTALSDWWPLVLHGPPPLLDHLVIGSGYGGAVAALRLAEAGHRVVVIERGSEFLPGEFPNDMALLPKFLRAPAARGPGILGSANGLFDWQVGQSAMALVANGLGGGSLINAGVLLEPDDDVHRQAAWPAALRHDANEHPHSLHAAMQKARSMLGAQAWPGESATGAALPKTVALQGCAPLLQPGAQAAAVHATIDPARCTRCGDCCSGCNVPGAKLTLRDTYLADATRHGAQVVCGAWAYRLEPLWTRDQMAALPATAPRWRVTVLATDRVGAFGHPATVAEGQEARVLLARHLILAAGTFGSTELLQRSQSIAAGGIRGFTLSPSLGSRFSGNGDALSFLVDAPRPVRAEGHGARPESPEVGPTITAVVDLRRHTAGPRLGQLKPMTERIVVEDGATPGAITHAAREMLALQYTLGQMDHLLARQPRAAQAMDALSAAAMGEHTQVMLSMGHDGAAGRIVYLADRDRSVPYWPGDPGELDTYREQARAFAGLASAGGVHLHPPSWQLLPASAESLMSGPKAPRSLLTVHPLGGCPMADRFDDGVVDDRGRVWADDGLLWPGLMVLDGSIVPTSLGVNPLLTITALAERAIGLALLDQPVGAVPVASTLDDAAPAAASTHMAAPPQAFERRLPASYDVSLFERLTCHVSQFQMADGRKLHAEARIELGSAQWLDVWQQPDHRVQLRDGRLRLQASPQLTDAAPVTTLSYRMVDGSFELLPQGALTGWRRADAGWFERMWQSVFLVPRLLLAFGTWLALRGLDDFRRDRASAHPTTQLWKRVTSLARGMAHASEARRMRYQISLRREGGDDTKGPPSLTLYGSKDVRYFAGAVRQIAWWWAHRVARGKGQGVPPVRPSYWQQITNPRLTLVDSRHAAWRHWLARHGFPGLGGAWAWGRFEVDAAEMLAQAPLLLHSGDLTTGMQAQAAYGMHFLRHALKTHLSDFRLPDYSARAVADPAIEAEPLLVRGQPVRRDHHPLTVRRGRSEGEPLHLNLPNQLSLNLWHHRRPTDSTAAPMLQRGHWYGQPVWRARSVLLLHAFGQSGAMFTLAEPMPSLARTLLEQGFDVWVLDHRISTRLPYTDWPSTIDQIARFDIPAAISAMQRQLAREHLDPACAADPIQVFAFAQCIGGAALAMSLLDGQLTHGIPALGTDASQGPVPHMPMLAGAVISQTHPFLVGAPATRAKTWLPHLLRDGLRWAAVPLSVRGPVDDLQEAWLDRLLATMPVPDDEHCPQERDPRHHQDDSATCRRIRFIEAPLFKHRNLGADVHALLPRLFGNANLHLFAHAANCVEHERLVDNDGRGSYVRDDRWRQHFGLPVAFLHGELNELFDVSSARRSAAEHARLFPDMARRIGKALGQADMPTASAAAWILPDHGHVDPVLGLHATQQVFDPTARLFDALWRDGDSSQVPPATIACIASMPLAGPWLGHVERTVNGGLRVHLAFHVDDRYSGGRFGAGGEPGTRSWAFVRIGLGRGATLARLSIGDFLERDESVPGRGPDAPAANRTRPVAGYRVAHGVLEVVQPAHGRTLWLRGFTVHEMLMARELTPLDGMLPPPPSLAGTDSPPDLQQWSTKLLASHVRALRHGSRRRHWLDPASRQVSRQSTERWHALRHVARLGGAVLHSLQASDDAIEFAASCCRYPGMAVDARRVDEAAVVLLDMATEPKAGRNGPRPAFAMLLGDQIYADATAGLVDSLNPVERYVHRHREAMAMGEPDALGVRRRALGDLLARVPTYLTQDDHEFRDGWPGSGPLQAGLAQGRPRERRLSRVAHEAVRAFQRQHMPERVGDGGSYCMTHGPVRFFVLDTRTERRLKPQRSTLSNRTREAVQQWWQCPQAQTHLNCLVSGSVLLPRLAPDCNPADPGEDTLAWTPDDRDWMLGTVEQAARRGQRFLLLSGDYHVSAALRIRHKGVALGAAVIAPPLYAPLPYANTARESLWMDEDLTRFELTLQPLRAWDGSGFSSLRVARRTDGGYAVLLRHWLRDHAQGDSQGRLSADLSMDLD